MKTIQCLFLGASFSGKTSLILHARHGQFREPSPTIGVETISYISNDICLQCWDTSSNPQFNRVTMLFVKNAAVVVYVFDQTSSQSLQTALDWHEKILLEPQGANKIHFLVGNKSDLTTANILNELLKYPKLQYLTSDARSLDDVKRLFETFIQSVDHSPLEIETETTIETTQPQECCTCQ